MVSVVACPAQIEIFTMGVGRPGKAPMSSLSTMVLLTNLSDVPKIAAPSPPTPILFPAKTVL
jgi:hypothetical protein